MSKQRIATSVLILFFCFSLPFVVFATQTTYTIYPTADTFVSGSLSGSSQMNQNYGLTSYLRIQNPTSYSHALIKFSQSQILSTIGTNQVVSANLKLYIETNYNNWAGSTPVDLHRIQTDWGETTATWSCPVDSIPNTSADCDPEDQWSGGFFDEYISSTVLHQNNQLGWQSFDVTSEIQIVQNGEDHFGWLIRKRDLLASGSVDYTSTQSASVFKPKLEITVDNASSCTPTVIQSVTPAIIPSDGTNQTISVNGQGLDRITSVLVDGTSVSFTATPSLLTLTRNYSTVGSHVLSFRSNCLTTALSNYNLQADTALSQQAQSLLGGDTSEMPTTITDFSRCGSGTRLCWNGSPARLIGYSGDFPMLTWNTWTSANIKSYFQKAQYKENSGGSTSRGTNFIRQFAMGGSCAEQGGGPGVCKSLGQLETMPFVFTGGEYKMLTTSDFNQLSAGWRNKLKNLIKNADRNGIAVMISLFDENVLKDPPAPDPPAWSNNPWNPNRSNVESGCSHLPTSGDALPKFYQSGPGSCLNTKQRYYVKAVAKYLNSTNLKICGSGGNQQCKNFFFEVMNEARLETGWSFYKADFKTWHNTVAQWVKGVNTGFIVAASVKGDPGVDECTSGSDDDVCMWLACTEDGCANHNGIENYFEVFTKGLVPSKIDIVAAHYGSWGEKSDQNAVDLCDYKDLTSKFNKPVIYDDDGGLDNNDESGRNKSCNVEKWAEAVSDTAPAKCNPVIAAGKGHYYHTGDGSITDVNSGCKTTDSSRKIDCQAWNGMADGLPTVFCPSGNCLDMRVDYCENKLNQCPQNCSN